jgi:hypothetical protein
MTWLDDGLPVPRPIGTPTPDTQLFFDGRQPLMVRFDRAGPSGRPGRR